MKTTSVLRLLSFLFIPLVLGFGCSDKAATGPDGGVYRTLNNGKTWEAIHAFPGPKSTGSIASANITSLTLDPQDHLVVYAGTKEQGVLLSTDGGTTWQHPVAAALQSGSINDVEVDPKSVCTFFVAQMGRLQKSRTCGRTFEVAYAETRSNVEVSEVTIDPVDSKIIWLGLSNGEVLRSVDEGVTWASVLQGKRAVTDIVVRSTAPGEVLIATNGQGVYRSTDAGATWADGREPLRTFKGGDRVMDLTQTKEGGTVIAATEYGLLRSVDFGATWEAFKLLTPPGAVLIPSVVIHEADARQLMYTAGTTLYRSNDGGLNWATYDLPTSRTDTTLLLDNSGKNVLYLGVSPAEKT